jgi:hydroxymethylglutaryl-CoA synthase
MQNCIDYVTLNQKKAIVVTTGKIRFKFNRRIYTSAGAPAMLITANPRIIAFENHCHKYQSVLTFQTI